MRRGVRSASSLNLSFTYDGCRVFFGTMQMISVSSSAIRAVGYDGSTLAVTFRESGRTYDHPGVPHSVYRGLMNASSKGAYYNAYIRGRY